MKREVSLREELTALDLNDATIQLLLEEYHNLSSLGGWTIGRFVQFLKQQLGDDAGVDVARWEKEKKA